MLLPRISAFFVLCICIYIWLEIGFPHFYITTVCDISKFPSFSPHYWDIYSTHFPIYYVSTQPLYIVLSFHLYPSVRQLLNVLYKMCMCTQNVHCMLPPLSLWWKPSQATNSIYVVYTYVYSYYKKISCILRHLWYICIHTYIQMTINWIIMIKIYRTNKTISLNIYLFIYLLLP